MKEYIVKADFVTEDGDLVEPDIVSELIRCNECKFYHTCVFKYTMLSMGNGYCGIAERNESEV